MGCYEHQPNGQFSDHLFQSSRSSRLPNCHIRTTIRNEARHLDSFVSAFSSDGGISRDSTTSIYAQAFMLDHFNREISCDQTCKWGIQWDFCASGLSCCFASEQALNFR